MKTSASILFIAMILSAADYPDLTKLRSMIERFAPVEIKADTSKLPAGDVKALKKLIEAARVIDDLYMTQAWSGNHGLYAKLQHDSTALGKARLHYYQIDKGPWSSLDNHAAFMPGAPERRPAGANFYPEDMTREEFETFIAKLPQDRQEQAKGFFSVVRRQGKQLEIVPYHVAYKPELEKMAALLRQAAAFTDNGTLRRFLELRAKAFLTDDYYESDLAWMDLDAPIDVTIGPYETYTDEVFGYKAAFEAYIAVRDDAETEKLKFFAGHLQEIEDNLPIDPRFRNPKIGGQAPIRVVNEILAAGDGAHGVRTAAFNLPNDERVVAQKGSKRVMLKNVQEAKFHSTLEPIAAKMLSGAARGDLSFDLFFTHILAHELSHGIGPHQIRQGGRDSTPRLQLKELYGAIEEAKADITGLFMLQYMIDHGQYGAGAEKRQVERQLYTTYLASSFRTLRFGLNEAHGKGMALQFNYLRDREAFVAASDGTYSVNFEKIKGAVRDLTQDILTVEATGSHDGAKRMLGEMAVLRPELERALGRLTGIATDIEPVPVTAQALAK